MKRLFLLAIFLLFAPLGAEETQKKTTVCLNMIVKDESHVIERSLASAKPLIDYWVIVDTGSTDGTQDVIREFLKDIPGELYERPWKNFGYNRTEALELAKGKADYLLFLDADDMFEYDPSFKLPPLTADYYTMPWCFKNSNVCNRKPTLVKASLPWTWIGVYHEYVSCPDLYKRTAGTIDGLGYTIVGGGGRSKDPKKLEKAVQTLAQAVEEEPNNERYVFYLAEAHRDIEAYEKAIPIYEKRVSMGGWREEVFWSLFQIALLKQYLNYPKTEQINSFLEAHRYRPHRAEPVYYLSEIYNRSGEYELAYECIKGWLATPKPKQKDHYFAFNWAEDWGLLFQLSIAAYYVSEPEEAVSLNDQLLKISNMPEPVRNQVEKNRTFSLAKLAEQRWM